MASTVIKGKDPEIVEEQQNTTSTQETTEIDPRQRFIDTKDRLKDPRIEYWWLHERQENKVSWTDAADEIERGEIEQVIRAYFAPRHALRQYIFTVIATSGDNRLVQWWVDEGHKLDYKTCKKAIKDI